RRHAVSPLLCGELKNSPPVSISSPGGSDSFNSRPQTAQVQPVGEALTAKAAKFYTERLALSKFVVRSV
ncbi:MAG: hypothetical protein ACLS8L_09535, partial [Anaerovoracaceae bacterium]